MGYGVTGGGRWGWPMVNLARMLALGRRWVSIMDWVGTGLRCINEAEEMEAVVDWRRLEGGCFRWWVGAHGGGRGLGLGLYGLCKKLVTLPFAKNAAKLQRLGQVLRAHYVHVQGKIASLPVAHNPKKQKILKSDCNWSFYPRMSAIIQ